MLAWQRAQKTQKVVNFGAKVAAQNDFGGQPPFWAQIFFGLVRGPLGSTDNAQLPLERPHSQRGEGAGLRGGLPGSPSHKP